MWHSGTDGNQDCGSKSMPKLLKIHHTGCEGSVDAADQTNKHGETHGKTF